MCRVVLGRQRRWWAWVLVALCWSGRVGAAKAADNTALDEDVDAGEADDAEPKSRRTRWNEYDGRYFTLRVGGGFLYDFASYSQDAHSHMQLELSQTEALRDLRLVVNGRLKFAPRVSYSLGYMYDAQYNLWRFRQTGIMIDMPELSGHLFFGRSKEGFSTSKIMVGYNGWLMERSTANDAFLPILADGVKWIGTGFHHHLVYNVGAFFEFLTPRQPYEKNDYMISARAVWLPFQAKKTSPRVLHLALEARFAKSLDGKLQFRAKPEVNQAQSYAVDTGQFPAMGNAMVGFEGYYREGPLTIGVEYYLNQVFSEQTNNPFFHGGDLFVAFVLTREARPYNNGEGIFEALLPSRALFRRGPGAWELVLRNSYIDLDSQRIAGGRFWRITPALNWYLSQNVRFIAEYGYGILARNGLDGGTHFFQLRLQFTAL